VKERQEEKRSTRREWCRLRSPPSKLEIDVKIKKGRGGKNPRRQIRMKGKNTKEQGPRNKQKQKFAERKKKSKRRA